MNFGFHRRDFLRMSAISAISYSRIIGANDRIHVGLVGYGVRGKYLMEIFQQQADVSLSAVCEVYGERLDQAQQKAPTARGFTDHRKMLEMQELEAVVVATPDHWHCPIAIEAMNAGKDVYVEKPLTLRIDEGPDVIKAARINGRVCQVGMQRHSGEAYLFAKKELIETGKLGKLLIFRCWWYNNPVHILTAPAALTAKPDNLDWASYLGQVKWRDWDPQQYWCFRAYLDFGGGQITDLFTHWIDVLQWYTGENAPCAATAAGGIYTHKDGRTAPDTIHAALEYPGGYVSTFDGALAAGERGSGGELIGTRGRLLFGTRRMEFHSAEKGAPPLIRDFPEEPTGAHVRDFLECMRTRQRPVADVLVGHRAARSAHLCNIAYREQKRIRFDPVGEEIVS